VSVEESSERESGRASQHRDKIKQTQNNLTAECISIWKAERLLSSGSPKKNLYKYVYVCVSEREWEQKQPRRIQCQFCVSNSAFKLPPPVRVLLFFFFPVAFDQLFAEMGLMRTLCCCFGNGKGVGESGLSSPAYRKCPDEEQEEREQSEIVETDQK